MKFSRNARPSARETRPRPDVATGAERLDRLAERGRGELVRSAKNSTPRKTITNAARENDAALEPAARREQAVRDDVEADHEHRERREDAETAFVASLRTRSTMSATSASRVSRSSITTADAAPKRINSSPIVSKPR